MYRLLLIIDVYKMLIYTFKVYLYLLCVKNLLYVKYLEFLENFVARYINFNFYFGCCFLTIIFPCLQPDLITISTL